MHLFDQMNTHHLQLHHISTKKKSANRLQIRAQFLGRADTYSNTSNECFVNDFARNGINLGIMEMLLVLRLHFSVYTVPFLGIHSNGIFWGHGLLSSFVLNGSRNWKVKSHLMTRPFFIENVLHMICNLGRVHIVQKLKKRSHMNFHAKNMHKGLTLQTKNNLKNWKGETFKWHFPPLWFWI